MFSKLGKLVLLVLCITASSAGAQVNFEGPGPVVRLEQAGAPFGYFLHPTTVIGNANGPSGTEITPEGYWYTGYSELRFGFGPERTPLNQPVRHLLDGYLPVVEFSVERKGLRYDFCYFADSLSGRPADALVNFAKITVTNLGNKPQRDVFWVWLQAPKRLANRYFVRGELPGEAAYGFEGGAALTESAVLYLVSPLPTRRWLKLGEVYKQPAKLPDQVSSGAPLLLSELHFALAPGKSLQIVVKQPFKPGPLAQLKALKTADFDRLLQRHVMGWRTWLAKAMTITVPETKPNDTWRANLLYLLIAADEEGKAISPKVNEFQYDFFWIRDGAFIIRAFDVYGLFEEAHRACLEFLKHQRPDGLFISQAGQLDSVGQALWTISQHCLLANDMALAKEAFPALWRQVEWLEKARAQTKAEGGLGAGLLPATHPHDNENAYGHLTGNDFWAHGGLVEFAKLARKLGRKVEADRLQAIIADYEKAIESNLQQVTPKTGGYIPPTLEGKGHDWGNLKMVYMGQVLAPYDPRVTATLEHVFTTEYNEGLMTYAGLNNLHGYIGLDLPETWLVRGEQQKVINQFYAELLHTTLTNGGFEMCSAKDRDFGGNLAPHGCYAGKLLELYRNMFVRSYEGALHLTSAVSPVWCKPGERLVVRRAPTVYGPVNFAVTYSPDAVLYQFTGPAPSAPKGYVLHLPWWRKVVEVSGFAGCKLLSASAVWAPCTARRVKVKTQTVAQPDQSFAQAVANYRKSWNEKQAGLVTQWSESVKEYQHDPLLRTAKWACSSYEPGSMPWEAFDGNPATMWGASPFPQWLALDLGQEVALKGLKVLNFYGDGRYYRFKVYGASQPDKWRLLAQKEDKAPAPAEGVYLAFAQPVRLRYLKIVMEYNSANIGVHIKELQLDYAKD